MNKRDVSTPSQKLTFITTARLHRDKLGRLRAYDPLLSAEQWAVFSDYFKKITILARIDETKQADEGYLIDPSFDVVALPFYDGMLDYFKNTLKVRATIAQNTSDPDSHYYAWAPSVVALPFARRVKKMKAPLLIRVMGDPQDVALSILPFPLNQLAAQITKKSMQKAVRYADAVIYVTLRTLQEKYPPNPAALTLARTNMQFSAELGKIPSKTLESSSEQAPFKLIAVGSQERNYKGHDLLIEAVGNLQSQGYSVSLTLVGAGKLHNDLKEQAHIKGVTEIEFIERLGTSLDVAKHVSKHDLFVMPSRTEGMPKALLEAMSVGVVSVGSNVGGISELLDEKCLFPPESVPEIERTIQRIINDVNFREQQRKVQAKMVEDIKENYSGTEILQNFLEQFTK